MLDTLEALRWGLYDPTDSLPPSQIENINRLQQAGELGSRFADIYSWAAEDSPELAEILIIPTDKSVFPLLEYTGGAVCHQGHSDSGLPELYINTGDGIDHYQMLMTERRIGELNSENLGIDPSEMTPQLLADFIFLHELGHSKDFLNDMSDIETYENQRDLDMGSLPLPNLSPPEVKSMLTSPGIQKALVEGTVSYASYELAKQTLYAQEAAYHATRIEDYANQFAARMLRQDSAAHKPNRYGRLISVLLNITKKYQ